MTLDIPSEWLPPTDEVAVDDPTTSVAGWGSGTTIRCRGNA
jgi:hypothetical protein